MHHSKFITILKSLNPTEFRQFYRYLQAPLLTQSKDVLKLYDIVRKYTPTFDAPQLDRQKVFKKLYPKRGFDTNRFSILLFKLTKILDEYLIFLKFQQDEFQKKKLLTQIYGERNLNVIFKKNTEELLEELEEQLYQDSMYFYDKYFLQQDFYLHVNTSKQRETVEWLKDSIDNLQNFFLIERFRLGIDLKNRERFYAECHDFNPNELNFFPSSNNIIYTLLKEGFGLLETGEMTYFFETKNKLIKNLSKISKKDALIIFPILINYVIQQLPKQESVFLNELFELYKIGIQSKLLIINNKISNYTFLNIAMTGAKLKKYEYVHKFIEENEHFLIEATKEDTKKLAISALFFNQEDYDNVIKTLETFKFHDALNKITGKLLLIRTYYKLFEKDKSYYNLILSNCDSFDKFIKRDSKINIQKKEASANFIFLLKKIIKVKFTNSYNKNYKSELMYLLNNFTNVYNREWIKAIIESI